MPRAFLITHRRYNGVEELEDIRNDYNLEHRLRLGEYGNGQSTSDGASDCGSESSSECPEELYNLTKLAEVSLAAAAGTLNHPSNGYPRDTETRTFYEYRARDNKSHYKFCDKTRVFFERIETEREILAEQEQIAKNTSFSQDLDTRIDILRSGPLTAKISTIIPPTKRLENGKNEDCIEDHECPDCGKKYSTSSNLARHRQTHRSLGDKKARRCPHCDKVYVSIPAFSMHVRTHNQGCKCHFCGKCFSRPWLLQGHIRTHTGEKPFKCTICNKAFADKSNLRAHIQTHSNTKPHICGRCGKAFALKSYLYKHEESSCMRTHQRSVSDKRDYSDKLATPLVTQIRASPTSVIVSRNSAFSTIVRRDQLSVNPVNEDAEDTQNSKDKEFPSTMVVRTSVISSNPEHFNHKTNSINMTEMLNIQKPLDVR